MFSMSALSREYNNNGAATFWFLDENSKLYSILPEWYDRKMHKNQKLFLFMIQQFYSIFNKIKFNTYIYISILIFKM
jgi:hypothetical protein